MEAFGKCFGQSVREGLGHDRIIVVMVCIKPLAQFIHPDTGRDGERPTVFLPMIGAI